VLGASSGGAGLGNLPGVGMLGSATGLVIASLLAIGTYLGVSLWRRRQARI
jgi:hypothetical protein